MTSSRIVCLRSLALLAALICSLTTDAAPLYARGDVHIVLVVSTTDPEMQDAARVWEERIKGALNKSGLEEEAATYEILEGRDACPENIERLCREVSEKAEANDAIAVFMVSHGGTVRDGDGVERHVLLPADNNVSTIIRRDSIVKALTVRKHRLVVLVTDSCSVSLFQPPRPSHGAPFVVKGVKLFPPKKDGYLKRFLTEAEGLVNINSTDFGEVAEFWGNVKNSSADNPLVGTRFSSAFAIFATNGYYLDDELNPDDFYELLNVKLTREVENFNRKMRARCKQTLTFFNDDDRRIKNKRLTGENWEEYDKARVQKLIESGEFEVDEQ